MVANAWHHPIQRHLHGRNFSNDDPFSGLFRRKGEFRNQPLRMSDYQPWSTVDLKKWMHPIEDSLKRNVLVCVSCFSENTDWYFDRPWIKNTVDQSWAMRSGHQASLTRENLSFDTITSRSSLRRADTTPVHFTTGKIAVVSQHSENHSENNLVILRVRQRQEVTAALSFQKGSKCCPIRVVIPVAGNGVRINPRPLL